MQARHPQMPSQQESAGKHGDDDDLVKAQVSTFWPSPSVILVNAHDVNRKYGCCCENTVILVKLQLFL